MYDAETVSTRHESFYKALLFFYPKRYRKRFGQEMLFAFLDLYQEELIKYGRVGFGFWFSIFKDSINSIFIQHLEIMKKQGIKKYFHISNYNIIGVVLLLPFLLLLGTDFLGRLVQGDFTHYNRTWHTTLSHTVLYSTFNGQAYLLWITLVFAPLLAVMLNLIPVLIFIKRSKNLTFKKLFFTNPIAIIILGAGLFALLVVFGHDFFPCVINGLLNSHVNKEHILSMCRNA